MAAGISTTILNSWLDGLCRNVAWTQPVAFWTKLHLGDPGSGGTANVAGNTTRQQATFSAASGANITTSADIVWTNVSTAETYAWVSWWDASTAGTWLANGQLAATKLVAVGDTFTIAAGSIDLSVSPAA